MAVDHRSAAQWPALRASGVRALVSRAYWIEDPAGTFTPTTSQTDATHVLEDDGSGTYTMTAIASSATPVRMSKRGSDYIIRGAV